MILTLLYKSPLLRDNVHRNTLLFIVGAIIYVVIHWMLFSQILGDNELVKKYRNHLYPIMAADIIFVASKYREFIKKQNNNNEVHHGIKIEPLANDNMNKNDICEGDVCMIKNVQDKEPEKVSNVDLPEYKPKEIDIPTYYSPKNISSKDKNTTEINNDNKQNEKKTDIIDDKDDTIDKNDIIDKENTSNKDDEEKETK